MNYYCHICNIKLNSLDAVILHNDFWHKKHKKSLVWNGKNLTKSGKMILKGK